MQRIILLAVLVSLGNSLYAQIERPARLVLTQEVTTTEPDVGFGNPTWATVEVVGTQTLELAAGDFLVVDNLLSVTSNDFSVVDITKSGLQVELGGDNLPYIAKSNDVVVGPATCRLFASYRNDPGNGTSTFTYVANILVTTPITDLSALQSDAFGRIVIPENASGPASIFLEQSTDLINWVGTSPGTFDPSEERRFFRIRAAIEE